MVLQSFTHLLQLFTIKNLPGSRHLISLLYRFIQSTKVMNFIYSFAGLLLFQFFSCNQAVEVPKTSNLLDSLQTQKTGATGTVNFVFTSADGGQTWKDISNGLPEPVQNNDGGKNVFFADDSGLYLTDGNGIYHSEPNSTAPFWTKAFFPDEHASISPGKNGIYAYHYLTGILQNTNGTSVWSPIFTDFQEKRYVPF